MENETKCKMPESPALLKTKRLLYGYTQKDIAKILGISTKSYNFKENGQLDFKRNERVLLKEVFKMTEDECMVAFL